MKTVRILNCSFQASTFQQTLDEIFGLIARGERGWLCTVNVAILMMMRDDTFLQSFVDNAAITVADGQPLIWASGLRRRRLPERVTGVDLVTCICERAARDGVPVYLLGGKKEIVTKVAERLQREYPQLQLAGIENGFFSDDEAEAVAQAVADSGAKILITAMGVPRQERFLQAQWSQLGVNFAIGVGGSFDVISGLRSRAPIWVQNAGFEWAYRLGQEPRRLFKRYLTTNLRFLFLITRDIFLRPRVPETNQEAACGPCGGSHRQF